jgi:predicted RNase H-like nuclease (RuvC/YqgF family)
MFKLQHTKLKSKKNVSLLDGDLVIKNIDSEGTFTVENEAQMKALLDSDKDKKNIIEEGHPDWKFPKLKADDKKNKIYVAQLEIDMKKLREENASLKKKLEEVDTNIPKTVKALTEENDALKKEVEDLKSLIDELPPKSIKDDEPPPPKPLKDKDEKKK